MNKVPTVLGSVSSNELGLTLMHEHLVIGFTGWQCDALALPVDRETLSESLSESLGAAKPYGLRTIVDATPIDMSRDMELAKMVSDKTGLNIIMSTGLFFEALSGASTYFRFRGYSADLATEIYETFVKEITLGIGDTGVKAGVIKVATGDGSISDYQAAILKAAARASKDTGTPIITHTDQATMGAEQADLLISEGADPGKIMIGHMCASANLAYHTSVLEKGVSLGFDRLGYASNAVSSHVKFLSDEQKIACIVGLLSIGFANRIMLSTDVVPHYLGRATMVKVAGSVVRLFSEFIPMLKEAGVTDATMKTMMEENPRRFFGGE